MSFTDIQTKNWISHLPEVIRPFAYLARLDRPIGIWLLLLPGWWAIMLASGGLAGMTVRSWGIFVLFGVGAVVMRAAGCVMNDLWDRKLDMKVERTSARPLASGAVLPRAAFGFLALLLLAGLLILLQMNGLTIILGAASLPLIAIYPLMKRITWWPQAFLGLTFNFGALMGWSAVTGALAWPAALLYLSGIFWTLGYDTIYAHQDREDDALAGIKSTALKFGAHSRRWVIGFYVLALVFLGAAFHMTNNAVYYTHFLMPAAVHMLWQVKAWQPESPQSSLDIFKSNTIYGVLVLAAAFLVFI